jgi:hypothetical protein
VSPVGSTKVEGSSAEWTIDLCYGGNVVIIGWRTINGEVAFVARTTSKLDEIESSEMQGAGSYAAAGE